MLAPETVKRRLDGDGMSYTEFSYLLLQSQDYLHLYRSYGCRLQIGGSDQWGNIVGGVDLIRTVEGAAVHALTTPLVTDGEGRKFGKSTGGGNIWLDPEMTSPYAWYQYFVNVADADVVRYLRMLHVPAAARRSTSWRRPSPNGRTLRAGAAPAGRGAHHAGARRSGPPSRWSPRARALFGRGELRELDAGTLDAALAEVPHGRGAARPNGPTIVDLLVATGLAESRGAARRTVGEGGAYVNNAKIPDEEWALDEADLLAGRWLVVRRGKRNLAGVRRADPRAGAEDLPAPVRGRGRRERPRVSGPVRSLRAGKGRDLRKPRKGPPV